MNQDMKELIASVPVVREMQSAQEVCWENPRLAPAQEALSRLPLTGSDIDDAQSRLARFAPFIQAAFPETAPNHGLIESPLTEIPAMKECLNRRFDAKIAGRLFLKRDSDLAVAGSVKARGGIYEILKHSEDLAVEHGLVRPGDDYAAFASPAFREFFSKYAIHVGSTGNLGLSIGIISAALGYRVTVHMSADARQWKKDLLRTKGVTVMEYASDYSRAVQEGRKLAEQDPMSYFVDDENSVNLFLGYAVAARRLAGQLKAQHVAVDAQHPLFVDLPCGVGGAPGGITFGLKETFGDNVHCFFVEPTQAPCMLLGMATGKQNDISVQDIGLTGLTCADGLAVGRPSKFVGKAVGELLSGEMTVRDAVLFDYLRALDETELLFIEPSACAAFHGAVKLHTMAHYLKAHALCAEVLQNATHIAWATGGVLVPQAERSAYLATHL
ncbi:MAG: D-serine ammonia-lyase [Oscillibacter sp.]|jgi:D-serine dehydratase|nr:D-serine ammonia-lyase [Oscillibacter sp.]